MTPVQRGPLVRRARKECPALLVMQDLRGGKESKEQPEFLERPDQPGRAERRETKARREPKGRPV